MNQLTNPNILSPLTERGWLSTQPAAFQEWIARNGRWQHYHAKQVLYAAGEDPDALYGLGEGALEVTLPLVDGEPVTLHRAEPGFWVGESALLARTTRLISLEAAADARVYRVPAASIRGLVAERPEYWSAFYELSHINVTTALMRLAEGLVLSPQARLARLVLRLCDAEGRVPVRQEDLARLIGMTRSSLQRTLQGLVDDAAVSRGYGCILVRDRAALERISAES